MKRKFRDLDETQRHAESTGSSLIKKIGYLFLGLFVFILGCSIYLFVLSRDLPSLDQLENYKPKLASKVYSSDMKVIKEYFEEKRSYVTLEELPVDMINAVIATEDRRFFDHWGFNLKRVAQAAFINFISLSYNRAPAR